MNILIISRVLELSEIKTRHEKLKQFISNWKHVAFMAVAFMTVKIMAEQLVLIFIRGN